MSSIVYQSLSSVSHLAFLFDYCLLNKLPQAMTIPVVPEMIIKKKFKMAFCPLDGLFIMRIQNTLLYVLKEWIGQVALKMKKVTGWLEGHFG